VIVAAPVLGALGALGVGVLGAGLSFLLLLPKNAIIFSFWVVKSIDALLYLIQG
jgi:hypothetical protein